MAVTPQTLVLGATGTVGRRVAFEALRVSPDSQPNGVIAELTGHEPRSFERFAAEAARAGSWAG